MVAAMSSERRRERRNHVVPRSISRLESTSIDDWTESSTLLSSASIACHSGTKPKISRDSKDPDGPFLAFAASTWTAFTEQLKASG